MRGANSRPVDTRALARRTGALVMAVALLLALPTITTTGAAAQPVTFADWMRAVFVTPDRKIDPSHKGTAVAPPPLPPAAVQASSEPAPPKEPIQRVQVPRLWFRGDGRRSRRRRRQAKQ
jgi:hypothetical protein